MPIEYESYGFFMWIQSWRLLPYCLIFNRLFHVALLPIIFSTMFDEYEYYHIIFHIIFDIIFIFSHYIFFSLMYMIIIRVHVRDGTVTYFIQCSCTFYLTTWCPSSIYKSYSDTYCPPNVRNLKIIIIIIEIIDTTFNYLSIKING